MGKKKSSCEAAARRAWRRLRIILLWAQEGGLLKCRLMAELRHMPKQLKGHYKKSKDMIQYGERQLSFDETPMIHFRMSRPSSLRSFLGSNVEDCQEDENEVCEEAVVRGDSRIDDKADEFIARFYEQMKLQRQISYQQRCNSIKAH
uniref:Uncharacterized protein n=1 Tax=Chenopodium quinoa TaxID=63459 RepID=A0A803M7L9_CHEQI